MRDLEKGFTVCIVWHSLDLDCVSFEENTSQVHVCFSESVTPKGHPSAMTEKFRCQYFLHRSNCPMNIPGFNMVKSHSRNTEWNLYASSAKATIPCTSVGNSTTTVITRHPSSHWPLGKDGDNPKPKPAFTDKLGAGYIRRLLAAMRFKTRRVATQRLKHTNLQFRLLPCVRVIPSPPPHNCPPGTRYTPPNIIRTTKSSATRLAQYLAHMKDEKCLQTFG
jgi:hypothetical protein